MIGTANVPAVAVSSSRFSLAVTEGLLVAGDTLFLKGCGRTDFPREDSDKMCRSWRIHPAS
jgi:glyoxylase-like metal-dependent hydrolase (beta-lactamase superfamily II)